MPELQQLTRTLRYSRAGAGLVTITDEMTLASPQTFEESLPSHGAGTWVNDHTVRLTLDGASLWVEIAMPGGFTHTAETVQEMAAPAFTRLGFKARKPVTHATFTLTFRPTL